MPSPLQPETASPCILLASADPTQLRSLAEMLSRRGFKILIAHDGLEALTVTRGHTIAAAILDGDLRELSPVEVLQALQLRQSSSIATWFTIARYQRGMAERARAAGARLIFTTPLQPARVTRHMERSLGRGTAAEATSDARADASAFASARS